MHKLISVLFLVGLLACNSTEEKYRILKPKEFEQVIYEIHVADAMLKLKNKNDRSQKSVYESYYNHIFLKHQISQADFEANIRRYSAETGSFSEMYEKILNRLLNEKNELEQVDTTNKKELLEPVKK